MRTNAWLAGAMLLPLLFSHAGTASAAGVSPALAAALLADSSFADCAKAAKLSKTAYAAKAFDLKPVTLKSGEHMTVAYGVDACVCAAQNCPTLVLLAGRDGAYRTVLSDYTIEAKVLPDGSAVLSSHDSAAVSDRSTYRWNGTAYALTKAERVHAELGVKPMSIPVTFKAGASSATVSGKAAFGFGDTYTLGANAGQTMEVQLTAPKGRRAGGFTVFHRNALVAQAATSWKGTLPGSGQYSIAVDGAGEVLQPYTLHIAIR